MNDIFRIIVPLLVVGAGLFSIVCTIKEYPFFWEHRRAKLMVWILGRTGARVFYLTLGVALVVIGMGILTGWLATDAVPWTEAEADPVPDAP